MSPTLAFFLGAGAAVVVLIGLGMCLLLYMVHAEDSDVREMGE